MLRYVQYQHDCHHGQIHTHNPLDAPSLTFAKADSQHQKGHQLQADHAHMQKLKKIDDAEDHRRKKPQKNYHKFILSQTYKVFLINLVKKDYTVIIL